MMRVAIGCDHRGIELKEYVIGLLVELGHSYEDRGTYTTESVDYPDIAQKIATGVAKGDFEMGILICSTGIGMCMSANKVKGIRAALCHDTFTATRARLHNDANVLCLGAEVVNRDMAKDIITAFLNTKFEGGRHIKRLEKMQALEC
jgi:ribose 5-phosphate isomerase B